MLKIQIHTEIISTESGRNQKLQLIIVLLKVKSNRLLHFFVISIPEKKERSEPEGGKYVICRHRNKPSITLQFERNEEKQGEAASTLQLAEEARPSGKGKLD